MCWQVWASTKTRRAHILTVGCVDMGCLARGKEATEHVAVLTYNLQKRKQLLDRVERLDRLARKSLGECAMLLQEVGGDGSLGSVAPCGVISYVCPRRDAAVVIPREWDHGVVRSEVSVGRVARLQVGKVGYVSVHMLVVDSRESVVQARALLTRVGEVVGLIP